jgi:hypothetical protein
LTSWPFVTIIHAMKNNRTLHIALAGAVITLPMILIDPAGPLHFLVALVVTTLCILLIIIFSVVMRLRVERAPGLRSWMYGLVIVVAIQPAGWVAGMMITMAQEENAKTFCDHLVPIIDSVHSATGRYPDIRDVLAPDTELPILFARWAHSPTNTAGLQCGFYRADTSKFYFDIPALSRFGTDTWRWDSDRRVWFLDD